MAVIRVQRRLAAVLLVTVLLCASSMGRSASADGLGNATSVPSSGERWKALSTAGAPSPRFDQTAVWTGSEMLVWGGFGPEGDLGDGARYNPATDTWTPMSQQNAPVARSGASAVWTGTEVLIWGGYGGVNQPRVLNDGAAYTPATDTWTSLPPAPLETRVGQSAVWTGTELLIWGGQHTGLDRTRVLGDGAAYNPATHTWRLLSSVGAPLPMVGHTAVWTGKEMLIWGQSTRYGPAGVIATQQGGRYDPARDAWTPLPSAGAPPLRGQVAVWTGSAMVIWGERFEAGVNQTTDGARYDSVQNTWSPISLRRSPGVRGRESVVWSGREMIVWGGWNSGPGLGDGGAFDPAADGWRPLLGAGAPSPRAGQSAVWTGTEMIVWGGFSGADHDADLGDGARYTPPAAGDAGVALVPHDGRYFPQTGFRIDNDAIWAYFNRRGGIETFGYPTSRTFVFQGFSVQFFQRRVVQLDAAGQPRLLNLLDAGLLPYTQFNGSTVPAVDDQLLAAAPAPSDATATMAYVRAHAPDMLAGRPVRFYQTFLQTVSAASAFPAGGDPDLLPGIELELWGLPTSAPSVDPKNHDFVYLRWQRGIMLYDAACNCTQGLLLADYLKDVLRLSAELPRDVLIAAQRSPLYAQYCPGAAAWVCRPSALPATDLTAAFEPG